MKKSTPRTIIYKKGTGVIEFPDKCLAATVYNKGAVDVIVDESETLAQTEAYPYPVMAGYYLTGSVKIHEVTTGNVSVHLRCVVEV